MGLDHQSQHQVQERSYDVVMVFCVYITTSTKVGGFDF